MLAKPKIKTLAQSKINLKDRLENGELDLSMSDLQEVPVKDIALIRKATSLDLSNNRLTTLGKNFVSLTHIVKLDLSKNSLKELPENFGVMKQLKHLDLYSNQLSHLPLSFSELKALRWLDVKNNPLVPAIAQVAGPCLDTPQCQQCAKRVVSFLAQMKASVEEERNRRAAQKQKSLENAESANSANSKNDTKKNKKNKNEKNLHGSKSDSVVTKQPKQQANNQPKAKSVKSKKSKGKSTKKGSIFKRLITAFLFSFILSALIMYTLSIKDPKRYDLIKETASSSWNKMLEMLPPAVSEAINKTVEHSKPTVKFLKEKMVEGADKAIEFKDLLYQNENFASLMNRLNDLWSVVYIKINEIYRTIYISLTDTTKNK